MKKNSDRIPLMFRAQVEGRCQIQRLPTAKEQAEQWTEEWIEGVDENIPKFSKNVQTRKYQITWRFITNSGQDETVTRPVIGAKGFPWYPGSSMKGAFLRACPREDKIRYCGGQKDNETKPGILRFHGGYPQDLNWIEHDLVDVVHPQQGWQTQTTNTRSKPKGESAFVQISLYQPNLVFGISSLEKLSEEEWEKIWKIWEQALAQGIGSRVSAGYGQAKLKHENRLFSVYLKGQGLAPKLINDTGEFRANMFKAALRGHTLRLFGGVTDAKTTEKLTKELWGGFAGKNGVIVGQLGIAFDATDLRINNFTYTPVKKSFQMPIYQLNKGKLDWLIMGNITEPKRKKLKKIALKLIKFTLLLGGFGKSWRRADHRLFFPDYLDDGDKPMIGCHWEFINQSTQLYWNLLNKSGEI